MCTRFLPLAIKYSTLFSNLWRWKTKNFSWNPLITFSYIRPYVKHTELFTVINVTFRVTTQICISVLVAVFSSVLHCLPSTIFFKGLRPLRKQENSNNFVKIWWKEYFSKCFICIKRYNDKCSTRKHKW